MLTVHVYWSKKNFSKYNIFFILQLQSWPIMTDEGKTDDIGSSPAPPPPQDCRRTHLLYALQGI